MEPEGREPPPRGCSSESTLLDLLEGRLDAEDAKRARAHLLMCSLCQEIAADVVGATRPEEPFRVLRRGERVGRYEVIEVLGAGAMGVVYAAHDPELARRVALKLVRAGAEAERAERLRERLLREAQAMARLAHPNVIAAFDVGSFGEQVFVAMELVRGDTLSSWLAREKRTVAAIVDVFVQAGRGLAAAHAAGLVHRDFKPDNVLVGDDGRVRVTDFGLARGATTEIALEPLEAAENALLGVTMTRTGAAIGTPAYMAPEQIAGEHTDARVDVYAFSVALYEALHERRPFEASSLAELKEKIVSGALAVPSNKRVPSWLDAVVRRGLRARADDRWASMQAMLDALTAPRRGKQLAVLTLGAVSAIALGVAAARARPPEPVCAGAEQAWGNAWSAADKTRAQTAFTGTGKAYAAAAFAAVDHALEARRTSWIEARTEACRATRVRHEQSEALLDRRIACLDDRRRELLTFVRVLGEADADMVSRAPNALEGLPPVSTCSNTRALAGEPAIDPSKKAEHEAISNELAEARSLHTLGRYERALAVAVAGAARAKTLGDPRLYGAFLFERAREEAEHGRYHDAEITLHESVAEALRAGDDAVQVDAWTLLSSVAGYRFKRAAEAHVWSSYAEAAHHRLGDDPKRLAHIYMFRSLVKWSVESRLAEAREDYRRAHALAPDDFVEPDASATLVDMGLYDEALASHEAAHRILEAKLGRDHTDTYYAALNMAEDLIYVGRAAEAIPILHDLYDRFPLQHDGYANHRLGAAYRAIGEPAKALEQDTRALELLGKLDNEEAQETAWALTGQGLDLLMLGRAKDAHAPLERAASLRKSARLPTAAAETSFALARALDEAGNTEEKARTKTLAEAARRAYAEAANAYSSRYFRKEAEAIETWQRAHP
ncbi:Serine/threonine kinase PKN8 [Minicystis rosea]|nr:Serine/threonine kinase PKN8 [Minicystis rosea]